MNSSETQQTNTEICEKHGCEFIIEESPFNEVYKKMGIPLKTSKYCPQCDIEFREEKQKRFDEEIAAEEHRRKVSGVPEIYRKSKIEDFKNIDPILKWLKVKFGFLFIHGPCGCGKTHLASAIKLMHNKERKQCDLIFSSGLFLEIRKSFNSKTESEFDIINRLAPDPEYSKNHFVIFDDIGAQKISDYVIETWYNIINNRYMNNQPTIFTSNLSLAEISVNMTDRIASRLASGAVFELKGNDKRIERDLSKIF